MDDCIIEQTDVWHIVSHSNGGAYTITHKPSGGTGFVQYGDEATQWRDEYEAMQLAYANPKSVWYHQTWNVCLMEVCGPPYVPGTYY